MQYLFIIAIIALIAIVLVPVAPIIIFIFYIKYNFELKKYNTAERDINTFWLTSSEKRQYKKLLVGIVTAEGKISHAEKVAKKAGISRNMDGQYSVRSNVGKQVREVIDTNERILLNLERELSYLSYLPYRRWEEVWGRFPSVMASKMAAKNTLWVWFSCVVLFAALFWQNIWIGIARIFLFPINLFGEAPLPPGEWVWILGITFVTLVAAMIFFHFGEKNAESVMPPPPPTATEHNYLSWGMGHHEHSVAQEENSEDEAPFMGA